MRRLLQALSFTLVTAIAAGCSSDTSTAPELGSTADAASADTYIVLGKSENRITPGLLRAVQAAGGTVQKSFGPMGMVIATSTQPDFASKLRQNADVDKVSRDRMMQWVAPQRMQDLSAEAVSAAVPPAPAADHVASIGDGEPLYFLQWWLGAIDAPEAWNAGARGAGIRVAVLDGGIYDAHPDLAGAVDVAHSTSFVPGQAFNTDVGTFWHGTHVAGIIAARANHVGTIGVAPEATIVGVKVLHNGSGSFSWIINGIYYASTPLAQGGAGANIINMSLGAHFIASEEDAGLIAAIDRAVNYAYQMGTTVVVSAGNDATNADEIAKNEVITPANSPRTVTVSALGPLGWAYGATNFDRQASYTNWGAALIDVAAPGGDFAYPGNERCNVGGIVTACWVFDMVLSSSRAGWSWAAGTSMAAPTTAGVIALIMERNGPLSPMGVASALRHSVDDLGPIGFDALYGWGRVNALKATQ